VLLSLAKLRILFSNLTGMRTCVVSSDVSSIGIRV
jgi:hypothetical protein